LINLELYSYVERVVEMRPRIMKRSVMVPVRIDEDLLREVDVIALRRKKYRSELIREALRDLVKKSAWIQNEIRREEEQAA